MVEEWPAPLADTAVGPTGSQLGKLEGGKPMMGHLKAAGLCPVTSLLSAGLPFPHQTHVH